jgi:hypothetical protein
MNNNTNHPQGSLSNLPPEMILEISKHLNPVDYISLYITSNSLKNTSSVNYEKIKTRYLHIKFQEIIGNYLKHTNEIAVFAFDYFSENNDVCYDGKTPSFRVLYERLHNTALTLDKDC